MYVIDQLGNASPGSQVRMMSYTVPENTFPFADDMNTETTKWRGARRGGPRRPPTTARPSSWTDSPGASYANSVNTALATVRRSLRLGRTGPHLLDTVRSGRGERRRPCRDQQRRRQHLDGRLDGDRNRHHVAGRARQPEPVDRADHRLAIPAAGQLQYLHDGWYVDDVAISNSSRVVSYPLATTWKGRQRGSPSRPGL